MYVINKESRCVISNESREFFLDMLSRWIADFYDDPHGMCVEYDLDNEGKQHMVRPLGESVRNMFSKLRRIADDVGANWSEMLKEQHVCSFEVERVDELIRGIKNPA